MNTQKSDQLKYRLQELFEDKNDSQKKAFLKSADLQGITDRTFRNHRKITIGQKTSISEHNLRVYAQLFDVSIDEILNYKIDQPSIEEVMNQGSVSEEFNLQ